MFEDGMLGICEEPYLVFEEFIPKFTNKHHILINNYGIRQTM